MKKHHYVGLFGLVGVLAFLGGRALKSDDGANDVDAMAPKDPRMILSRVWFDRKPGGPSDEREIWIFLAGGLGIHEKGSWWRVTMDIFDFERQGNKVTLTWLHDKKKAETRFDVETCDDTPPFNLCLTLQNPPRGPKKLYGFRYDDDMDRAVPWAKDELKYAEVKARFAHDAE